jgi:Undecaprenyl-phosphate glucose phosphotransferase
MSRIDPVRTALQPELAPAASRHLTSEWVQIAVALVDIVVTLAVAGALDVLAILYRNALGSQTRTALIIAVLYAGVLVLRGGYSIEVMASPRLRAKQATLAWLIAFGLAAWIVFLLQAGERISRLETTAFFLVGGITQIITQVVIASGLSRRMSAGSLSFRRCFAVVLGDGSAPQQIEQRLRRRGTEIVGSHQVALGGQSFAQECIAALEAARSRLAETTYDCVLVFAPWREERQIEEAIALLGALPIPVVLMADVPTRRLLSRRRVDVGSLVGYEISRAPLSRADRAVKRLADVAIASSALVLLSPLLLIVATGILVDMGRPIFFRQNRRGFGGREFRIWKFRSMTVQENGPDVPQARRNDPRVTPLGRILRRTSIDELPQLLNVLKGEMSIVGPRPHAIAHDNHYDEKIATYAFRQHVKPGITGWAQVNGLRGETRHLRDMAARVEHDLWYINNWSFWLDIRIIVRTALKAVVDRDAY